MSKKPVSVNSKNKLNTAVIFFQDDSYFNIIAKDGIHSLIPLVNVPIFYYTFTQLINAKFTNFIIFCGVHHKKVKDLFNSLNIKEYIFDKCNIEYISADIRTTGDAIRFLDNKKFEKSFVLINGDIVTDLNFNSLIETYEKESKNSDIIMARILSKKLPEELKRVSKITNNFYDPELFICSSDILLRFNDHEDCTNMDDLIDTMISNAELIPDKCHDIIIEDPCYRIRDLVTYTYVSKQLIRGVIKKLSPKHIFGDNIDLIPSTGKILTTFDSCYINSKLPADYISSSSKLIGNVQIMNGTKIGDNARFEDSIIGYNCEIGNNVTLKNCFLMDNVVIENNCTIVDSFLCSRCLINSNCVITDKSVIDYDFVVDAQSKVERKVLANDDIESFWDVDITEKIIDEVECDIEEIDNDSPLSQDLHLLLKEALEDKISVENLIIEANRLKHENQLSLEDLCFQLVNAFVSYYMKEEITTTFRDNFSTLLVDFGGLITNFTGNNSQLISTCLEAIEESACYDSAIMEKVLDIYYSMYDKDIFQEADILTWYKESSLLMDSELKEKTEDIRKRLENFITYLKEAEEESD